MSTQSNITGTCVFCSGPVGACDLYAEKRLCNFCMEEIAHSWFQLNSTCSSCAEDLKYVRIEEGDAVLCEGCGGMSVAEAAPSGTAR